MGNLFDELRRHFPNVVPRTCRKVGYIRQEDADAKLAQLLASRGVIEPETLHVYRCKNCGQLHVGHKKEKAP